MSELLFNVLSTIFQLYKHVGAKAPKREWTAQEKGSIEVEKDGKKGIVRERKQKLEPQILVWSLAFDQFTLGAPAGSMKAPDDTARRFIKTHKPPHHDKVFEEVGVHNLVHEVRLEN